MSAKCSVGCNPTKIFDNFWSPRIKSFKEKRNYIIWRNNFWPPLLYLFKFTINKWKYMARFIAIAFLKISYKKNSKREKKKNVFATIVEKFCQIKNSNSLYRVCSCERTRMWKKVAWIVISAKWLHNVLSLPSIKNISFTSFERVQNVWWWEKVTWKRGKGKEKEEGMIG